MLKSMTGFGDARYEFEDLSFVLEIKTVNNKYLKISVKLPDILAFAESELEKLIKNEVSRGSVYLNVYMKDSGTSSVSEVNSAAALHYLEQIKNISHSAGISENNIDLVRMLFLPGICQNRQYSEQDNKRFMDILEEQTRLALVRLSEMRTHEGLALLEDLRKNCKAIADSLMLLEALTPEVVLNYQARLESRVNDLLASAKLSIDQDTLVREVAIFADKCDINEEISRLRAHLEQFDKICIGEDQVGRRLDFLTQEMLREANTIASKANNARISQYVVDIKVAIDRLREQVQNVE